tara:strand:- start:90 stop:596 length:507 start_codon:yes stop_codon:yes gene_type:complete
MDETPRQRLARLMAGVPAPAYEQPFKGLHNSPYGSLPHIAGDQSPQSWSDYAKLNPGQAFFATNPIDYNTGRPLPSGEFRRDDVFRKLPPFEQPGGSLPMDRYMNPPPAPASAPPPQYAAPMPQQPMPAQSGGQGYAGPDPMLPPPYDPMTDPRYLPEQWRGSFTGNY